MKGFSITALALATTWGCATETGIMVVIDSNPELPRPTEIIVMVGEPSDDEDLMLETFVDPESDRFEIEAERDIAKDPLRYLIRPDAGDAIKIAVAGLGGQLDQPLTAHYADTLEFAPDVVLEIRLTLDQRPGEVFEDCSRCFVSGETPFQVSSEIDADCDGSFAEVEALDCADHNRFEPLDCDDRDSRANPHLLETCDGVDNDCDGRAEDYPVACFVDDLDSCLLGTTTCNEGNGFGDCSVEGEGDAIIVPGEICVALADCKASPDPASCYAERLGESIRLEEKTCEIAVVADGDNSGRLCSSGPLLAFEPGCLEVLVVSIEGPRDAGLSFTSTPNEGPLSVGQRIGCAENTAINLGGEATLSRATRLLAIELGEGEGLAGHVVNLQPRYVEACGPDELPLECF